MRLDKDGGERVTQESKQSGRVRQGRWARGGIKEKDEDEDEDEKGWLFIDDMEASVSNSTSP